MIKNIFFSNIIVLASFLFLAELKGNNNLTDKCQSTSHAEGTRFIRDFPVQHTASSGSSPRVARYNIILHRGTTYRIYACNDESKPGEVIISLYRDDQFIATSYDVDSDRHFPYIEYEVNASGQFALELMFKGGKEGRAVGILSTVE